MALAATYQRRSQLVASLERLCLSLVRCLECSQAHFLVVLVRLSLFLADNALPHCAWSGLGCCINVALEALAEQDVGASVVEPNDETHQGKHNAVMAVLDLRNAVEAAPCLRQAQLENRAYGSNS